MRNIRWFSFKDNKDSDKTPVICEELYDLAMLSHKQLSPEEMTRFVQRSKHKIFAYADKIHDKKGQTLNEYCI